MSVPGGGTDLPDEAWNAAGYPNRNGPRRGRWFGDDAPWGRRRGTVLLGLLLVAVVALFVVSCLT